MVLRYHRWWYKYAFLCFPALPYASVCMCAPCLCQAIARTSIADTLVALAGALPCHHPMPAAFRKHLANFCQGVVEATFHSQGFVQDAAQSLQTQVRKAHRSADVKMAIASGPMPAMPVKSTATLKMQCERLYLARYFCSIRARFMGATHLHVSTDGSRIGGRDTDLFAILDPDSGFACWGPPQDWAAQ